MVPGKHLRHAQAAAGPRLVLVFFAYS